jgi:hypothetical protein
VALAQMAGQLKAAHEVADKLNVTIHDLNSQVRVTTAKWMEQSTSPPSVNHPHPDDRLTKTVYRGWAARRWQI